MTILALLATLVGIFMGLSNIPQALKIFKRKSARDISLVTYLIVEFGSIIWILYGFEIKSFPVVVPNILGLIATSMVLIGYFLYGKSKKKI